MKKSHFLTFVFIFYSIMQIAVIFPLPSQSIFVYDAKIPQVKKIHAEGKNPDKPDEYIRALNKLKTGGDITKAYPTNYKVRELKKAMNHGFFLKSSKVILPWEQHGPDNIGGRTRCLIVDPEDKSGNTWFAGAVGGGIWRTFDAGKNWVDMSPKLPNLSISCMAFDPSNSNIIYAGTGEGFYNIDAIKGNGIFKSIDKGTTWEQIATTSENGNFEYVNRLIVSPTNSNRIIVATNTGVFATNTGGLYWERTLYVTGNRVQQVVASPDDFDIQFATVKNKGIYKSFDAGGSWISVYSKDEGRIELAISEKNADRLVAITQESDVLYSIDQGENWSKLVPDNKVDFLSSQGWYNNCVVFHPDDANRFYVGGIDIHEVQVGELLSEDGVSIDAYNISSTKVTNWSNERVTNYAHADHHMLLIDDFGSPFRILDCNDGGISFSTDAGTNWHSPNKGYITSQFYGAAKHPDQLKFVGGMQDNGTAISLDGTSAMLEWEKALGGDGFSVLWNNRNSDQILISQYYNSIVRTDDGGENWYDSEKEIEDKDDDETAPFITQLENSNSDPNVVFSIGKSGIWRSENFGKKWELIPIIDDTWVDDFDNGRVAVSDADPSIVWAGTRFDRFNSIYLSKDGGRNFSAINSTNLGAGVISKIVTHPLKPQTVFILFSYYGQSKIIRSDDLGDTWKDITGFESNLKSTSGFPDVAVYSLVVMPDNDKEMWAGTEIGLFITADGGNSWSFAGNGLPAVCIWDMHIINDRLVVATHGRGVWSLKLDRLKGVKKAPYIVKAGTNPKGHKAFNLSFDSAFDSICIKVDNENFYRYNISKGDTILTVNPTSGNNKMYSQIEGFYMGDSYFSNMYELVSYNVSTPVYRYENSFEEMFSDFEGKGFNVENISGFSGNAIHSEHPYAENDLFYYQLKKPIVISNNRSMSTMSYYDIAFIEEGEQGVSFPNQDFYDYVVVEGTKNGVDWLPLALGYDYSLSNKWKGGDYDIDDQPSDYEFVKHSINLQDTFKGNDTILIRFKLYSDPYSTGWGWIVDDIEIQVDVEEKEVTNKLEVISNLSSKRIVVHFQHVSEGNGFLEVFNVRGERVAQVPFSLNSMVSVWSHELIMLQERAGIYFARIHFNGEVFVEKFILK